MAISQALKELMAQKANKYKTSGGNTKKLKEGRNVVRVIAPKPGEVPWVRNEMVDIYRDLGVHWIKPSENAKPLAVVGSTEVCYGQVSAVSAAVEMALASSYDDDSKKLFESWKARASVLVNLKDRADGSVELYDLPKGVWGKIMELWNMYAEQDFDIFDHDTGIDLVITRTGKGLNTQYDVAAAPMLPGKAFAPITAEDVSKAKDPEEYIKANFFRGEDQKALSAIAQIAGISVPQLGAPATPTAALSSPSATVSDAPVAQPAQPAQPAQVEQLAPAPANDPAAQAASLAMLIQQQKAAAAPAAPAAPSEPAPTPTQVDPMTSLSDMTKEQQDDLLAQLSKIV